MNPRVNLDYYTKSETETLQSEAFDTPRQIKTEQSATQVQSARLMCELPKKTRVSTHTHEQVGKLQIFVEAP